MGLGKTFALALGVCVSALSLPSPGHVTYAADEKAPDVNSFIGIAKDAQKIAKDGDFKKARERIKELEKAWDDAEDVLRPKNSDAWRDCDRKIDKTLDKLRDGKPDQTVVNDLLTTLVASLESFGKGK